MAHKKILAMLAGGGRDASVLANAFATARPYNAHVVALFASHDPAEAMPLFGEGFRQYGAGDSWALRRKPRTKHPATRGLDSAASGGADLLVLGGYGHSRLRQLFADGVTKHVVSQADIQLFLVH